MNDVIAKEKNEFNEVVSIIENRKRNAYLKVNEELINMYWDVGKYISDKVHNSLWGSKTVQSLANYIKVKYPNLSGFDRTGIYRMKQFYEMYCDDIIVAPMVRQFHYHNTFHKIVSFDKYLSYQIQINLDILFLYNLLDFELSYFPNGNYLLFY